MLIYTCNTVPPRLSKHQNFNTQKTVQIARIFGSSRTSLICILIHQEMQLVRIKKHVDSYQISALQNVLLTKKEDFDHSHETA